MPQINPTKIKKTMLPLLEGVKYSVVEESESTVTITADKEEFNQVFKKVKIYPNTESFLKSLGLSEALYNIADDYAVIPAVIASKITVIEEGAQKGCITCKPSDKDMLRVWAATFNQRPGVGTRLSDASASAKDIENLSLVAHPSCFEYVPTATYRTTNFAQSPNTILASGGLSACATLVIVSADRNIATMAHFFPDTAFTPEVAERNLKLVLKDYMSAGGSFQEPFPRITVLGGIKLPGQDAPSVSQVIESTLSNPRKFENLQACLTHQKQHNLALLDQRTISTDVKMGHYVYVNQAGINVVRSHSTCEVLFKEDPSLENELLRRFPIVEEKLSPKLYDVLRQWSQKVGAESERLQRFDPEGTKTLMPMIPAKEVSSRLGLGEGFKGLSLA